LQFGSNPHLYISGFKKAELSNNSYPMLIALLDIHHLSLELLSKKMFYKSLESMLRLVAFLLSIKAPLKFNS